MYNNYFSNFGRPLVPDDLCKDSAPRHPQFWRRRFLKVFTIYREWQPSWSTDRDHFSNLSFLQPKEAPYEIWVKLAQQLQRRSCLKMLTNGWTDDGWKVITIAHPEHSSGELKMTKMLAVFENSRHTNVAFPLGVWFCFRSKEIVTAEWKYTARLYGTLAF